MSPRRRLRRTTPKTPPRYLFQLLMGLANRARFIIKRRVVAKQWLDYMKRYYFTQGSNALSTRYKSFKLNLLAKSLALPSKQNSSPHLSTSSRPHLMYVSTKVPRRFIVELSPLLFARLIRALEETPIQDGHFQLKDSDKNIIKKIVFKTKSFHDLTTITDGDRKTILSRIVMAMNYIGGLVVEQFLGRRFNNLNAKLLSLGSDNSDSDQPSKGISSSEVPVKKNEQLAKTTENDPLQDKNQKSKKDQAKLDSPELNLVISQKRQLERLEFNLPPAVDLDAMSKETLHSDSEIPARFQTSVRAPVELMDLVQLQPNEEDLKTQWSSKGYNFIEEDSSDVKWLPSVSKVLSITLPNPAAYELKMWRRNISTTIGEDGFLSFCKVQFAAGIDLNKAINARLTTDYSYEHIFNETDLYLKSLQHIVSKISSVKFVNGPVVHKILGYRGVFDAIVVYSGKPLLLEWRRSNTLQKYNEESAIQLAAYMGALNVDKRYKDIQVKEGAIVQVFSDGTPAKMLMLSSSEIQSNWNHWVARLKQYSEKQKHLCFSKGSKDSPKPVE